MNNLTIGVIIIVLLIFIAVASLILLGEAENKQSKQQRSYTEIAKGDSKDFVFSVLGNDYSKVFLPDGIEKYTWKYRVYREVSVKFRDNVVIEIEVTNSK